MTARAIARYTRSTALTSSPARNGPRRSRKAAGRARCGPSRTTGGTHFTSCANTLTSPRSSSLRCGRQDRARQADGPPRKARGVIVTGFANHLHVHHGGEPVGRWVRHENAADQLAVVFDLKLHQMRNRAAQIGIAGRRGIDELRFEVWPLHRHEVPGVGPAERAMHALPLLQRRIGTLDRAKNRLAAYRVKGTETDCDRRTARDGRSLERDVVKRERAGKFAQF